MSEDDTAWAVDTNRSALDAEVEEFLDTVPRRGPVRPGTFISKPHAFSIGSMEGSIFREGFRTEVDYALVKLTGDMKLFFRTPIPNHENEIFYPLLQGTSYLDDIQSVQLVKTSATHGTLTVTLRRPPRLEADFRVRGEPAPAVPIRRATEIDWNPCEETEFASGPLSPLPSGIRARSLMKFGLWLTYRFEWNFNPAQFRIVKKALDRLRTLHRPGMQHVTVDSTVAPTLPLNFRDEDVEESMVRQKLDFESRYLITGLISQGVILISDALDLVQILWKIPRAKWQPVLRALYRYDYRNLCKQLEATVLKLGRQVEPLSTTLFADRVRIKRVTVTPTRVLLYPDHIETSNSVLRQWPAHVGNFLRARFTDEDGKINVADSDRARDGAESALLSRIANALREGLVIAGRHYVALATGESQMKDGGCWMICESGEFTADNVRARMGDFSREHVVAKYSARMGLCFSSTSHVVELQPDDIDIIEDVQHDKYKYTDGVGNCSAELAELCGKILGSKEDKPFKGVLSVHSWLKANQVCLRESMKKFDSPQRGLGVMRVSHYAPAHLNRQAIAIMTALGASSAVMLSMFKGQIAHAESLERSLDGLGGSKPPGKHLYRNSFLPIGTLLAHGLAREAMLHNVVRCISCQLLHDLKYKARILVQEGAYLMGVADEFDVLEEGEIYCAITPSEGGEVQIITGQCTLFRSPCIHPGDVRLVTAVDYPVFRENGTKNVVVFSTKKAARDLPSMLGGGDLDGDFYTVIYDKDLQITEEYDPMDYTPVKPVAKDIVEMPDIWNFFVDFFINDKIGIVASDFQAWADKVGPRAAQCLELAKLNSDAVDFAKSGVPVRVPSWLNPREYPDFMSK
ncbi:RNA dependent RNA polymerase-domain-containing protein, partial [Mycena latifolia]